VLTLAQKIENMGKIEGRKIIMGCTDKYAVRVDSPLNKIPDKRTYAVQYAIRSGLTVHQSAG
jgi:hypothetical protein